MQPIFDLHADVFMDLVRRREERIAAEGLGGPRDRLELEPRHLNRMKAGGIGGAVLIDCRMAGEIAEPLHLERFIQTVPLELEAAGDSVAWVRSAAQLREARAAGRFAAIVGYEGLSPMKGDLSWLPRLYAEAGLRVAALTHNDDNELGGGALGAEGGGKTPSLGLREKGREALSILQDLGVLIDLAHAGRKTRQDILEASKKPLMLSHTSAASVYDTGRNLSASEMRAIAEKGGLIGCMTSAAALAPLSERGSHTLERYMLHLKAMLDAVGTEHVSLGLHFCEYLYTEEEYPPVSGLEDASKAQSVIRELEALGYSEAEIEKITWGNFQRVFGEAVG
ncbi:MAG TPA: membrane dipeptidase [Rectinemataceae bacterium]